MRELQEILDAFAALGREGETAVLASVVAVEGSTYRRTGARALITPGGQVVGSISGGCLEGDLALRAEAVRQDGAARRVRYDSRADEDRLFGLGLGCRGVVDVLLERVSGEAPGPLDFLARCHARRLPGVLVTRLGAVAADGTLAVTRWTLAGEDDLAGPPLPTSERAAIEVRVAEVRTSRVSAWLPEPGGGALLFEALPVRPRLLLLGAGPDARPLVDLARGLGWVVEVVDPRAAFARPERFPSADRVREEEPADAAAKLEPDLRTAVVVMNHHYERDRAALARLLEAQVGYVGVLGPRARTEEMLADLSESGCNVREAQRARLFAPAGLDIGAESAPEIALAIVAEIQAALADHPGASLRNRRGPIHRPREPGTSGDVP